MKNTILVIQIIISVILIVLILIQSKGSGLGRSFGSGSSFSRRGLERFLYKLTFIIAILFVLISIVSLVV